MFSADEAFVSIIDFTGMSDVSLLDVASRESHTVLDTHSSVLPVGSDASAILGSPVDPNPTNSLSTAPDVLPITPSPPSTIALPVDHTWTPRETAYRQSTEPEASASISEAPFLTPVSAATLSDRHSFSSGADVERFTRRSRQPSQASEISPPIITRESTVIMSQVPGREVAKNRKGTPTTGFYVAVVLAMSVFTIGFIRLIYVEGRMMQKKARLDETQESTVAPRTLTTPVNTALSELASPSYNGL
jgi:hypothetical protein